jgi:hypothetical protein
MFLHSTLSEETLATEGAWALFQQQHNKTLNFVSGTGGHIRANMFLQSMNKIPFLTIVGSSSNTSYNLISELTLPPCFFWMLCSTLPLCF